MRGAWILVVVACAPARPEKLESPASAPRTDDHRVIVGFTPTLVPRPEIDLGAYEPDFHDELRWPLTAMSHPSLEPRFAIAQAFAQPGVGWIELCGRGIQNRYGRDRELLEYLRGWCNAVKGDVDAACANLVPLFGSTVLGLQTAVRTDLANILANEGHADKAEHYINAHDIRDVGTLDLLAANYVEVGTVEDALTINRNAIDSDDHATASTKCLRWTKQIVLLEDRQSPLMKQIEAYATQPKMPDETCLREHHKLACWSRGDCAGFVTDQGGGNAEMQLINAYDQWGSAHTSAQWWTIADTAMHAGLVVEVPLINGAGPIVIAAMENAVAVDGQCTTHSQYWVRRYEPTVRRSVSGEWTTRLDALMARCK